MFLSILKNFKRNNTKKSEKPFQIGYTLSGGAVKGFAHLGVLKSLEEHGIYPDVISGVSAGSIVASLYADGKSIEDILAFFKDAELFNFAKFIIPRNSLMSMERFKNRLENELTAKTFEELKIPLYINATNLDKGHNTVFSKGLLIDKIIASASVPLIFSPTEIDDDQYVDGGIFSNLPVSSIRDITDTIIAINLNPIVPGPKVTGLINITDRVYHFLCQGNVLREKKLCDLLIEPPGLRNYGMFDLDKYMEIYEIGYNEAEKVLNNMDLTGLKEKVKNKK